MATSSLDAAAWFESEVHRLKQNDAHLVALNLSVMGIVDGQAQELVDALKKNSVMRILILYENRIRHEGAQAFSSLLKQNCTLQELWLPFNDIGDEGAVWLAEGLRHNTSLKTLRLDGNHIGPEGAIAIGQCLKHAQLQELHLSENCMGDIGAKGLAAGLVENRSVTVLHVSDNHIGNEGVRAIGRLLQRNNSLRVLYIGLNAFKTVDSLLKAMEQNFSLKKLSLFGMDTTWQSAVDYHTQLNRVGRRILRESHMPTTLWADFLAKLVEARLVHYFVLAKPDLFQQR